VLREATNVIAPLFEATDSARHIPGPPAVDLGSDIITVLSVSPVEDDHDTLEGLLGLYNWRIRKANSLASGVAELRQNQVPLVISERDLSPGSWREILAEAARLPVAPFLVVTSRCADEYLWAEALNIGAYDVLAKPFDAVEVTRVVSLAWLNWKSQHQIAVDSIARRGE
jgi:DNA-binding response OmpR family regulator